MLILNELKRRNVFRVGAGYLAGAWLLIQLTNEIAPLLGLTEAIGRFVLILAAIGLVPTLVLVWVFELTPEGLRRDYTVDHAVAANPRATRRFDRAVILVLALGLAFFAAERFLLDPARDAAQGFDDKSIAVLAFKDFSPDSDQEYFSDGISETILDLLAKIPELRVIARTSAFAFKGTDATIAEIAETLDVNYVLEGSVRRDGDQVRITAQLIEGARESHVWSETYNREVGSVFAIQDEIAANVIAKLRISLLGEAPSVEETEPELYALFLQAVRIHRENMTESFPRAREILEHVTEEDPRYLPAWHLLMWTYNHLRNLALEQQDERTAEDFETLARMVPDRIETLAPADRRVSGIRAWIAFNYEDPPDLETAARYFEMALADPNADERRFTAIVPFLLALNRPDDAVEVGEYVLARDPLCLVCYNNLALAYYRARQYGKVEEVYRTARGHELMDTPLERTYALALLLSGDAEGALRMIDAITAKYDLGDGLLGPRAMALHDLGRHGEFAAAVEKIKPDHPGLYSSVLAHIGDLEPAVDIALSMDLAPRIFDDPLRGDAFRTHERWPDIAARADLANDPRKDISFTVNLPK